VVAAACQGGWWFAFHVPQVLYNSPGSLNGTSFQIKSCFFLSQDSHGCPRGALSRREHHLRNESLTGLCWAPFGNPCFAMAALRLPWHSTRPGHPGPFLLSQSKMLLSFLWDICCLLSYLLRPLCLLTTPGNTAFLHTFVFFCSFPIHPVLGFPRLWQMMLCYHPCLIFHLCQIAHLTQRRCSWRIAQNIKWRLWFTCWEEA